jgi:hypothetical protein
MKKRLILLLCAATGVGIIAFAEITPGQKPAAPAPTEQSQMRDEIKRLQAKVEMLDYRTKSLESTIEQLRSSVEQLKRSHTPTPLSLENPAPAPAPSMSAPGTRSSKPPTIWGQGEVNGWTYYIVPCKETSR